MKLHNPELISALVDGELKGLRRFLVQRHVRGCALCAAEYRHQHHVRNLLADNPPTAVMGDSADFFWSKVKREIQAREGQTVHMPLPRLSPSDWLDTHRLALASAVAACAAIGLFIWIGQTRRAAPAVTVAVVPIPALEATVERVSTAIPNSSATAVDSDDKDTAVIWVTGLPWTPNLTAMKTKFAHLDT